MHRHTTYGTTTYHYDPFGNRDYDDNSGLTIDRRDYTYDSRNNLVNVHGIVKIAGVQYGYDVGSMFDARGRRVMKTLSVNKKISYWFMYYDLDDKLTEIQYLPDSATPTTYSVFEIYWLNQRPVLYWQTDYPSATVSKRYIGTDEMNRPIDMGAALFHRARRQHFRSLDDPEMAARLRDRVGHDAVGVA